MIARKAVFFGLSAIGGGALVACSVLESFSGLTGDALDASSRDDATTLADAVSFADASAIDDAGHAGPSGVDATTIDAADASEGGAGSSYRDLVMSDGPVLYLRLGDPSGAAIAKDETGTYSATITSVKAGMPGAIAGDPDRAMEFDGLLSTIDLGTVLDFDGTQPFTLEAWALPTTIDSEYRFIVSKNAIDGNGRQEFGLLVQGTAWAIERYVNSGGAYASTVAQTNAWVHIAAVYDGAKLAIFTNGAEADGMGDTRVQPTKPTSHFTIGAQDQFQDGVFAGSLDEIAVYAKALSPQAIAKHYAAGTGN